jgi:hypothetical protein
MSRPELAYQKAQVASALLTLGVWAAVWLILHAVLSLNEAVSVIIGLVIGAAALGVARGHGRFEVPPSRKRREL